MDRRKFLRISALTSGALMIGGNFASASTDNSKKVISKTHLQTKGYVSEPAREIPVVDSADIVIAGGGPAGFAAAVAAARQGLDVLVLERQYFLGGLFTGCGVTPIIDMYSPDPVNGKSQAVKGICDELCRKLDENRMLNYEGMRPKADPEAAKYLMEEMIDDSGARILYGVQISQVVMFGDRIEAIILDSKSGRVAIRSKFVIDCSGDGDILDLAGEDFTVYKDDIGAMWRIGNAANSPKGVPTAVKGVKTRHTVGENAQDGLDMYNLTRIQRSLRKMMWNDAMELRKNPGCEDLFLLDTPSVVGVRVTRVLNSVRNVSVEGAVFRKTYKDVIGYTGGESDVTYNGRIYKADERSMFQIPYSAITPKRVENLLVAGRCFGYERGLTYDSREVGTCLMTGQSAGTAAAMAVLSRCSARDIDITALQNNLRKQNVKID